MTMARASLVLLGSLTACPNKDTSPGGGSPDADDSGSVRDTADTGQPDSPAPDTGTDDSGEPAPRGTLELEWTPTGNTPSGRHHFASFSPDDPHRVYVGSVRSGLFMSTTNPPSFKVQYSGISPHAYSRVTFIPGSPETLTMSGGRYLNVSHDDGESWTQTRLYDPTDGHVLPDYLTGLAADEASVWLADDQGRIWESTDLADSFSNIGLIPSPIAPATKHDGESDDADSWIEEGPGLFALGGDALLAAWDEGSVYRSADRGVTWVSVLEGAANRSAVARVGEQVYVGLEEGVFRSDDDGLTFSRIDDLPNHCVDLSGSSGRLGLACDETLWVYDGVTATEISTPEAVLSVALSPVDAEVLLAGMYEGITWSIDGGVTTDRYDDGLKAYTFQTIAVDFHDPDHLIIGSRCSRGLFQTYDRAESWEFIPTGTHYVMVAAFSRSDSSRVYVTNGLGASVGFVVRSDDGGDSFTETAPLPDAEVAHPHGLAIHPEDADTLLVGTSVDTAHATDGGRLFLSNDGGASWSQVGTGLPSLESAIVAIDYDITDPNRVFVGTGPTGTYHLPASTPDDESSGSGDGLWVSNDGGTTFTKVGSGFEGDHVWDVEVSSDGTVFASSEAGIFRSDDHGDSWTELIPLEEVNWTQIAIAPTDPSIIAYAHGAGLGTSSDGGLTWTSEIEKWTEAGGGGAIHNIAFSADTSELYMTSSGHSMWRGTMTWHTDPEADE